jgi:SAM-dependent methyltransferase
VIKSLAEWMLRTFGVEISRMPREETTRSLQRPSNETAWNDRVETLTKDPLNASLHLQYAIEASNAGSCYLAYAEVKTAEYLGADRKETGKLLDAFRRALPDPLTMNHNQYFRFISLSSEILNRAGGTDLSVLDVGGGDGRLAAFIPNASYCLAEPKVNGISGTALPFPDHSFDYVVSCHVLEHIPVDRRTLFLDQLLSKARRGVILLNPFHVEGTHVEERLRLFVEITNAEWAKEHLDCTLPKIDDIKDYANDKGLEISIEPNGTLTTTAAFVFIDYFAAKSGCHDDWEKVNVFFNEKYTNILDSAQYPNSYLIYFGWPEAGAARPNHAVESHKPRSP